MIHFLTTDDHSYTVARLARHPAGPVRARSYEWLFRQTAIPGGTWIFTDTERLSGHELSGACHAATVLREAGNRVLNHPATMLTRAELLHALHHSGINRFAAYRAAEHPRPERFPVLLKADNDHRQPHGDLIHDQAGLDSKLAALQRAGLSLRHLLVIEFANDPIRENTYRKHSVYRVGQRYFPFSPVIEDNWAVKYGKAGYSTDSELDEAIAEMDGNPHAQLLAPAFEAAGIDYGRADFGFQGGHLAVFEINSNPSVPKPMKRHRRADFAQANRRVATSIREAIFDLESMGPPVKLNWPGRVRKWRWWKREGFLLRP